MTDMQEEKTMTKEQLDARLKSMCIKVIILRILTHGLVVVGLLAVPQNFFITLACLIVVPVFGIPAGRAIRKRNEIKKQLSESVIDSAVGDVLGYGAEYNSSGELKPGRVVVPIGYEGSASMHHIKTVYNGVNIELSNIILYKKYKESEYGTKTYVRFRGPWIICDFGKKPACGVYISEWGKLDRKVMQSNVKIDNEQFSSRFCVRADDPQEAYKILTPQMMEAITAAADKSGGMLYMSFLPDGKTNVAIQTGRNLFDTKKGCNNAEEMRQKFTEELRKLTVIVDTLNV